LWRNKSYDLIDGTGNQIFIGLFFWFKNDCIYAVFEDRNAENRVGYIWTANDSILLERQ